MTLTDTRAEKGKVQYLKPKPNKSNISTDYFTGDCFPICLVKEIPSVQYRYITEEEEARRAVSYLNQAYLIAVDTETTGLDPHQDKVLMVQIATPRISCIFDARTLDMELLRPVLENPEITKIVQNGKFDFKMLLRHYGIEMNRMYDTMLAERLLTAGTGASVGLAALAKKYADYDMDKKVRKAFYLGSYNQKFSQDQLQYAALDTLALFPIYTKQLRELWQEDLLHLQELESRCIVAVARMELKGCRLDTDKWRSILEKEKEKKDKLYQEMTNMIPGGSTKQLTMFDDEPDVYQLNLNSQQQVIAAFKKVGVKIKDTSDKTLATVNHPLAKLMRDYRGAEKTLSSFGEALLGLINPVTNRIHPEFQQYGADTGRFSCQNPNVQQIPATSDFRKCFIPADGYVLVTSDYSGCELRILAQLSQDPGFLDTFQKGGDLHRNAAAMMFKVDMDKLEKEDPDMYKFYRSAAKAINFGLAYGMGAQGLAGRISVELDEAKNLIKSYFDAFKQVEKWLTQAGKFGAKNWYSPTPLGRKRYYNPVNESDPDFNEKRARVERQSKNSPIQGCNADMTKMALVLLDERLRPYDARIVNTVHDEIVVEVHESQAKEVRDLVEHTMIEAGEQIITSIPVVSDATIEHYWKK